MLDPLALGGVLGQPRAQHLETALDHEEGVVDLVGRGGGQGGDRPQLLGLALCRLCLLPIGDVAHHAEGAQDLAVRVLHERDGGARLHPAAVLGPKAQLSIADLAFGAKLRHDSLGFVDSPAVVVGHAMPHDLVRPVAEHVLGPRAEIREAAVGIRGDDGVGGVLGHGLEKVPRVLGFLVEPRVLNRDGGVAAEGGEERHLLVIEIMAMPREKREDAQELATHREGNADEGDITLLAHPLAVDRAGIVGDVLDDQDLAGGRHPAREPLTHGQRALEARLWGPVGTVLGAQDEPLALHHPDARGGVRQELGGGMGHASENFGQLQRFGDGVRQTCQRLHRLLSCSGEEERRERSRIIAPTARGAKEIRTRRAPRGLFERGCPA